MRLTYVCTDPGIPVFGTKGASVHVQELLRAYRTLGFDVVLATGRTGGPAPADLASVPVLDAGQPAAAEAAAREAEARAVDDALEARLAGERLSGLVHERYSLWGGGGIRAAARLHLPSILEVNAPLVDEQATHRVLVDRPAAEARFRAAAAAATAVVAVSEPVAAWVRATVPGSRVHVVPNGVDPDRVRPGDRRDPASFTLGFVGTLKPWHGTEVLLDALALLRADVPGARLLVVGDGPLRADLEAAARGRDLPVEFTGALAPADVPAQLHRMDVACAPYPATAEAYFSPLKVLEYLAAGLPVVGSAVGQVPELLGHGRCGLLVPPGDPAAIAAACRRLAADPVLRAALGDAARTEAVQRHAWTGVVRRTLAAAGVGAPGTPSR